MNEWKEIYNGVANSAIGLNTKMFFHRTTQKQEWFVWQIFNEQTSVTLKQRIFHPSFSHFLFFSLTLRFLIHHFCANSHSLRRAIQIWWVTLKNLFTFVRLNENKAVKRIENRGKKISSRISSKQAWGKRAK